MLFNLVNVMHDVFFSVKGNLNSNQLNTKKYELK